MAMPRKLRLTARAWRALAELTVTASMVAIPDRTDRRSVERLHQARARLDHEIDCVSERHSAAEYEGEPAIVAAHAAAVSVHAGARVLLHAALEAPGGPWARADIAPAMLDLWNAMAKYERRLRAVRRAHRGRH